MFVTGRRDCTSLKYSNEHVFIGWFVEQKSSCVAPTLGVTKFTIVTDTIGSHFVVLLKSDLDFQKPPLRLVC